MSQKLQEVNWTVCCCFFQNIVKIISYNRVFYYSSKRLKQLLKNIIHLHSIYIINHCLINSQLLQLLKFAYCLILIVPRRRYFAGGLPQSPKRQEGQQINLCSEVKLLLSQTLIKSHINNIEVYVLASQEKQGLFFFSFFQTYCSVVLDSPHGASSQMY